VAIGDGAAPTRGSNSGPVTSCVVLPSPPAWARRLLFTVFFLVGLWAALLAVARPARAADSDPLLPAPTESADVLTVEEDDVATTDVVAGTTEEALLEDEPSDEGNPVPPPERDVAPIPEPADVEPVLDGALISEPAVAVQKPVAEPEPARPADGLDVAPAGNGTVVAVVAAAEVAVVDAPAGAALLPADVAAPGAGKTQPVQIAPGEANTQPLQTVVPAPPPPCSLVVDAGLATTPAEHARPVMTTRKVASHVATPPPPSTQDGDPTLAPTGGSGVPGTPAPVAPLRLPAPMPAPVPTPTGPAGPVTAGCSGGSVSGAGESGHHLDAMNAVVDARLTASLARGSARATSGFAGPVIGGADDPGVRPG